MCMTICSDSNQNEGIHKPRGQRDGHSTLAKSLPVTVPVFPSIVHRAVQDQDDDQVKPDLYMVFNYSAMYRITIVIFIHTFSTVFLSCY